MFVCLFVCLCVLKEAHNVDDDDANDEQDDDDDDEVKGCLRGTKLAKLSA